jgi:hypothetical protein
MIPDTSPTVLEKTTPSVNPTFQAGGSPRRNTLQQLQDQAGRRLDAARAAVAAQRAGQDVAALALQGPPAADAGGADAEPLRRLPVGRALGDRRQNACPKIN